MWRLKIGEGEDAWLRTTNAHVGRQVWEFDADAVGSTEEIAEARANFTHNRFTKKHSSDLLMRSRKNLAAGEEMLPQVRVKDTEEVTEEAVWVTLKRPLHLYKGIQAHDGHWPGDYGGSMFLMPDLVITLSVTRALNAVLREEHKCEMRRYLFNHQNEEAVLLQWPGKKLREKALSVAMEHIHYEDKNTPYICTGPVNKCEIFSAVGWRVQIPRIRDYLWLTEDGMKMQDTAFVVQAIIFTNLVEEYGATLRKAHMCIKNSQVLEDCPGDLKYWYRHISKGAWPFSTADHGWLISDCMAEGLKVNRMFKPDKWQAIFDSDGKVSGFQKALKLIVLGLPEMSDDKMTGLDSCKRFSFSLRIHQLLRKVTAELSCFDHDYASLLQEVASCADVFPFLFRLGVEFTDNHVSSDGSLESLMLLILEEFFHLVQIIFYDRCAFVNIQACMAGSLLDNLNSSLWRYSKTIDILVMVFHLSFEEEKAAFAEFTLSSRS